MIKTTLREIKQENAIDLSTSNFETIANFLNAYDVEKIAYSVGIYGKTGLLCDVYDRETNEYIGKCKVTTRGIALSMLG